MTTDLKTLAGTLNAEFPALSPLDRLKRLREAVSGRLVFTTSLGIEDQMITHLIFSNAIKIEVVTLDTGRLFPESYEVWRRTEETYGKRIHAKYPQAEALENLIEEQGIDGFYHAKEFRLNCCGVRKIEPLGRALAGAWQSVARPASWFARLWSAVTVLREHRGDGHVVAATACGLTGLQASITHVATGALDREVLQRNRGWTDREWADAIEVLRERGVLGADGMLTGAGVALRENVERLTDDLATGPWRALDDAEWTMRTLGGLATVLVDRGVVPVPNPMGVPRPA